VNLVFAPWFCAGKSIMDCARNPQPLGRREERHLPYPIPQLIQNKK
jgi:hypothetical protein